MDRVLLRALAVVGMVSAVFAEAEQRGGIYSPTGKRDPFKAPNIGRGLDSNSLNPLEKYNLEQFQLKAILRTDNGTRAMFQDPEGKVHIVAEGDVVGRERGMVSRIVNSEVIVTQKTVNYLGAESLLERVMSLPKETDLGSVEVKPKAAEGSGDGQVPVDNKQP